MPKRTDYFLGLDGLRAYAAVAVVVYHFRNALGLDLLFIDGNQAVNLFFVLSGFLITNMLLKEQRETGTIQVGRFYIRRALRILPLYYILVAVRLLLPLLLPSSRWEPLAGWQTMGILLMMGNVVFAAIPNVSLIGVLWSISIEEWFYAVWGFAVRSWWVVRICFAILAVRLLLSLFIPPNHDEFLNRLWESLRFECMALGALGAVLYTQYPRYFRLLQRLSLLPLIIALMALLSIYSPPLSAPMNMVLSVLYLALIAQVINRPGFMEHRALKWVGQRSYGMYIWHNTLISAAYFLGLPDLVVVPAVLVGVLLVSTLSYQYLERPFLRLKNRWRTSDQVVVATASLP